MNFPTREEFDTIFPNDKECFNYFISHNVFYENMNCPKCQYYMKRYLDKQCFRCNRRECGRSSRISIRKYTFFFGCSIKYISIMHLARLWLAKASVKTCILLTGHSSETVCNFFYHFRNLVTAALKIEDQIIGGPGIIVEIDETKLGKRKNNRGHHVEGIWVVVGIERSENKKIFLVPVLDRSSNTLNQIISTHVVPESIVYTNMWKGYLGIESCNIIHKTVNHSRFFKDPISGVCTNTAEGLNSGLKSAIPVRNRVKEGIEFHLGEYV